MRQAAEGIASLVNKHLAQLPSEEQEMRMAKLRRRATKADTRRLGILQRGRMGRMTTKQSVAAFNEWMRRYTQEPERFEAEFRSVAKFLTDEANGVVPSYGQSCTTYLQQLVEELKP